MEGNGRSNGSPNYAAKNGRRIRNKEYSMDFKIFNFIKRKLDWKTSNFMDIYIPNYAAENGWRIRNKEYSMDFKIVNFIKRKSDWKTSICMDIHIIIYIFSNKPEKQLERHLRNAGALAGCRHKSSSLQEPACPATK
ncbi:uncharacterized protein Dana_GF26413, isoform B [Drosophila ananassae]|uniref:Uncharacterized protein, isoform B n=1 Tax=Drosophila ananassae TaxID=7217 RepID=A0A0P8XGQ7_DROAN|nr:uncharacterized protein Dana_GF26413, isoform B [Drosophila ananassae]